MSIFGPITEHPEFPIEDDRRFTVVVNPHRYDPVDVYYRPFQEGNREQECKFDSFPRNHPIHKVSVDE